MKTTFAKRAAAALICAACLIALSSCFGMINKLREIAGQFGDLISGAATDSQTETPEETPGESKIRIDLPSGFRESSYEGYTAVYESDSVVVLSLRESRESCVSAGINSYGDYVDAVRRANSARNPGELFEIDGRKAFEYSFYNEEMDVTFRYLTVIFEAPDAYWIVQFACDVRNYQTNYPDFVKWAGTVRFES